MSNAAAQAKANALSVEVKKHAYRQTQDGIVISFVMHPNDVSPDLAAAALGTRYMAALVEIGDDEQPVEKPKERQRFDTLPAGQQAAMRCNEMSFWRFLEWKLDLRDKSVTDEECAAGFLRAHFKIDSRTKLNAEPLASQWRDFNLDYQLWCRA